MHTIPKAVHIRAQLPGSVFRQGEREGAMREEERDTHKDGVEVMRGRESVCVREREREKEEWSSREETGPV